MGEYYGRCVAARVAKQARSYERGRVAVEKAYQDAVSLVGDQGADIEQSVLDLVGDIDEEDLAASTAFAEALVAATKSKSKSKSKAMTKRKLKK